MAYRVNIKRFEDVPVEAFNWIANVVGDGVIERSPAFDGVLLSGSGWAIKTEVIEHTVSDEARNITDPLMKIFQSNLCQEICLPTIQYYVEFEEELYALQFKLML
jgi:hypothetical protein